MNECKYEPCSNKPKGSSAYCSDSCRAKLSRIAAQQNINPVSPLVHALGARSEAHAHGDNQAHAQVKSAFKQEVCDIIPAGSYDDYIARPYAYAPRTAPELLNWDDWMSTDQLKQAGLKANRVPIPGDHDYSGVCVEVDGVWQAA